MDLAYLLGAILILLVLSHIWLKLLQRGFVRRLNGRAPLSASEFRRIYFADDDRKAEIALVVRRILAEHVVVPEGLILPDDNLCSDLGMDKLDSLTDVSYIKSVEKAFQIRIPDADANPLFSNLRAMVEYVAERISEQDLNAPLTPA